jgi:hypothetical protein
MRFQMAAVALACTTLLTACGGSGGSSGGGAVQAISFNFPGGASVAIPPAPVATTTLVATATSGGPITYSSNTPAICSVSGTTLSLLSAGECSVTASQAGYNGYAAASQQELFVIPKNPQLVVFRNPGAQPLDSTPLPLTATSSVSLAVTFATSTPAVCSINGNSLLKLANGICTVTATQAGNGYYAAQSVIKNIPIGTALSPLLTFLSGYQSSNGLTNENGSFGVNGSAYGTNGWWCGGSNSNPPASGNCTTTVPSDGSSFTGAFDLTLGEPNPSVGSPYGSIGGYLSLYAYAPSLTAMSKTGNTPGGLRIDAQAAMQFNIAEDAELFSVGNQGINVDLILGHFVLQGTNTCNVTLQASVTPTTAAATAYSVSLKDQFTISNACGLTGLDLWNELQDYPISQITFSPWNMNFSVSSTGSAKPTYQTQLTLTGPITFQ